MAKKIEIPGIVGTPPTNAGSTPPGLPPGVLVHRGVPLLDKGVRVEINPGLGKPKIPARFIWSYFSNQDRGFIFLVQLDDGTLLALKHGEVKVKPLHTEDA